MDQTQRAEYLVETYADAILRLSYTYLKSTHDAQDVCQTVFVKLLTEPREFESPEHERAYILRMAANACKDMLKKPLAEADLRAGHRSGGPSPGGGGRVGAGGGEPAAAPLPGRYLSLLLRGLSGLGDRRHPGHPHRHRPHPAGPGAGEAEIVIGRNGQ